MRQFHSWEHRTERKGVGLDLGLCLNSALLEEILFQQGFFDVLMSIQSYFVEGEYCEMA